MSSSKVKLRQQQALFMGAFGMLVPELERSEFIDQLVEEAGEQDGYQPYMREERSQTAVLQFIVIRNAFSALAIKFNDPALVTLILSVHNHVSFGENRSEEILLSNEQCDALFEAFLDECRRLLRRHRIQVPPSVERFFTPK